MPTIPENRSHWNDPKAWISAGEEWSYCWGSTASLWFGTILPRLAPFLPTDHLLEIACGHGRVTAHLLGHCRRYTGIDLAAHSVATCRSRFAEHGHAQFHETDGRSLDMVEDGSVDFAISWDSLVHAEQEAVAGYIEALGHKLRPGGMAFLHHSNLADFVDQSGKPTVANDHWRATNVSGARVREWTARGNLECVAQELVQWGTNYYNDCFTLLRRPTQAHSTAEPRLIQHPNFEAEMNHFRQLDATYRGTGR